MVFDTGKSFSEVLILAPVNPQYDNRLFIDLRLQYEKIQVQNMLCTNIVLNAKTKTKKQIICDHKNLISLLTTAKKR
jgi:hypothetical protein